MIPTMQARAALSALILATTAAVAAPVKAADDVDDGKWHFTVTPYRWLPDLTGTVTYTNAAGTGGTITSEAKPSSYLESLDFAAMFAAEARKGRWLAFSDYMYLHLGGHGSSVKSVTGPLG